MTKLGIWFTQGFGNLFNALADIRSADTQQVFSLLCSHPHPQFVGQASADVYLTEPATKDEKAYLDFVLEVVKKHNVKVIFPSRRQAFFNKHAETLKGLGVTVATVASTRMLNKIDNKGQLYDTLKGKGLALVPLYSKAKTAQELRKAYRALKNAGERVCVKPTRGVYGSGFRVLKESPATMKDLLSESLTMPVADLCKRMRSDSSAEMLVMQYLDGDERSVDCLAINGVLVAGVVRRKSSSGVAPQVIENNPAVMAQVRALVGYLKLNGLFNVQFRDHKGSPYLLEINTRLSGRSYYATAAGVNLPYLAAQVFSGLAGADQLQSPPVQEGLLLGNVSHAVPLGVGEVVSLSVSPAKESC